MAASDEDLQGNLENHKLQLQTVEAALTNDPGNEELLKLQKDLNEVINLTLDLIQSHNAGKSDTNRTGKGTGTDKKSKWKVGDTCQAMFSENGHYYEAIITSLDEDEKVTVTFTGQYSSYGSDITEVSLLKPTNSDNVAKMPKIMHDNPDSMSTSGSYGKQLTKREKIAAEREWKRKKQQKKAVRLQKLEEERETEKQKWKTFNQKAFSKNKKGHVRKSIFASPESVDGKVGVGTCGVADRDMTKTQAQTQYRGAQRPI